MFEALSHAFGYDREGLIEKHKKKKEKYEQWENKLTTVKEISAKFIESYNNSKNTISIKRHGCLKTMIKEAIKGWQGIEKKPLSKFSNDDRKGHDYDHYYDKYFGDNKESKKEEESDEEKEEDEEYADKDTDDIKEEIDQMRSKIKEMKAEFNWESERLSKLCYDNENVKYLSPLQRYNELKRICKDFVK